MSCEFHHHRSERSVGWLLAAGCWLQATGCRLLAAGCWLQAAGWLLAPGWLLDAGSWLLAAGFWLLAAGCWLLAAGGGRDRSAPYCKHVGRQVDLYRTYTYDHRGDYHRGAAALR